MKSEERLSLFSFLYIFADYTETYWRLESNKINLPKNMQKITKEALDAFCFSLFKLEKDYEEKKYSFSYYEKDVLAHSYQLYSLLSEKKEFLYKSFSLYSAIKCLDKCRNVLMILRKMSPNDPKLCELELDFSKLVVERSKYSQNMTELLYFINPLFEYAFPKKKLKRDLPLQIIFNLYWEEKWERIIQIYEIKKQDILNSKLKIQFFEIIFKAYLNMSQADKANEIQAILQIQRLKEVGDKLIKLFGYFGERNDFKGQEWVISSLERTGVESKVISDLQGKIILPEEE